MIFFSFIPTKRQTFVVWNSIDAGLVQRNVKPDMDQNCSMPSDDIPEGNTFHTLDRLSQFVYYYTSNSPACSSESVISILDTSIISIY